MTMSPNSTAVQQGPALMGAVTPTAAPRAYRLFDLGGSGLKTCKLDATDENGTAAAVTAEACALTNLGRCPPSMPVHEWIRSRLPTLDDELQSGVWFGFCHAGLVKLGVNPALLKRAISNNESIADLLHLSGASRMVHLTDGVAHLAGTMSCERHASGSDARRVVNLAIGTGIACARTLPTGDAIDCDFLSWRCPTLNPRLPVYKFLVPTIVLAAGDNSSLLEYQAFAQNWKVALHWWLTRGWPFGNASRPGAVYITGWPRELPLFVDAMESLAKDLHLADVAVQIRFGPPLAQVRGLLAKLNGREAQHGCTGGTSLRAHWASTARRSCCSG